MKDKILIIGGYGAVGTQITTYLAPLYPNKVVIAGRNIHKANKVANQIGFGTSSLFLDLDSFSNNETLDNIKIVIVCLDSTNTRLVQACIAKGIIYIDISAQYETLSRIEQFQKQAVAQNSSIILSVGLAPGLTNLLAKLAYSALQDIETIDINVLLGLGEKHGDQAYRWTFNHIDRSYMVGNTLIKSFTKPLKTNLAGKRTFYTFDFSDQHVLTNKWPQSKITTRLAFDVHWFTKMIAVLKKTHITKVFKNKIIQNIAIQLFNKWSLGTSLFGIKIIARDKNLNSKSLSFTGYNQGKVTAAYTAELVKYVVNNQEIASGVVHCQDVITDIPQFINNLLHYDDSFKLQESKI